LALAVLVVVAACDRPHSSTTQDAEAGTSSQADAANPHELARRLIKRTVAGQQDGHVGVEIDHELLRELSIRADKDIAAFRDPLLAAWLFASHIGVPEDAMISIVQVSSEAEEASGLFIAVASVDAGDAALKMRLVSEPGADGRPTIWVLNDYDR